MLEKHQLFFLGGEYVFFFSQLSCVGSVPHPTIWSTNDDNDNISLLPLSIEAFAVPAARDTEIEDEEVLIFLRKKNILFRREVYKRPYNK